MKLTIAVCLIFLSGVAVGYMLTNYNLETKAIQHGYMQHNPVTGKVEWK